MSSLSIRTRPAIGLWALNRQRNSDNLPAPLAPKPVYRLSAESGALASHASRDDVLVAGCCHGNHCSGNAEAVVACNQSGASAPQLPGVKTVSGTPRPLVLLSLAGLLARGSMEVWAFPAAGRPGVFPVSSLPTVAGAATGSAPFGWSSPHSLFISISVPTTQHQDA